MKNTIKGRLMNINGVKDITFEDYVLFKQIKLIDKHPFLSGWGLYLVAAPFIAIGIVSSFLGPAAAVVGWTLGGGLGVAISAWTTWMGVCDAKENKELLKQYKELKKSNKWDKIVTLMTEYEKTDEYDSAVRDDLIHRYSERMEEYQKDIDEAEHETESIKDERTKRMTLVQRMINDLNNGADIDTIKKKDYEILVKGGNLHNKTYEEILTEYEAETGITP